MKTRIILATIALCLATVTFGQDPQKDKKQNPKENKENQKKDFNSGRSNKQKANELKDIDGTKKSGPEDVKKKKPN